MNSKLPMRLSLTILTLMILLTLSVQSKEVLAFYAGSHISVGSFGPIAIGYSSRIGASVKNTGTETWYSYPSFPGYDSQPGWIMVIRDLSWLPGTSYFYYVYSFVGSGETSGYGAELTPDRLPSSEGNFSFKVYTYYPKDRYGNDYLLMDNSPKSVSFTMLPKAPTLSVSMSSLDQSCTKGKNALSQSFEVWNSGRESFTYIITEDVEWLSVTPNSGSSIGEHDVIQVNYDTSGLSTGIYYGSIIVQANEIGVLDRCSVLARVSLDVRAALSALDRSGAGGGLGEPAQPALRADGLGAGPPLEHRGGAGGGAAAGRFTLRGALRAQYLAA